MGNEGSKSSGSRTPPEHAESAEPPAAPGAAAAPPPPKDEPKEAKPEPHSAPPSASLNHSARQALPRGRSSMGQLQRRSTAPMDYSSFGDDEETVPIAGADGTAAAAMQPEPEAHPGEGPLSVATRIEYAAIPRGKAQDIFGLVTLQAAATAAGDPERKKPGQATEKRQALDIVCVLDVSGSMQGEKLSLVQSAVRFVVQESQADDRLSLVSFHSAASRALRLRRMHTEGKDEATSATLRLRASGGTDIASGLEMGLQVMERRQHRNPVSAILLLTDGQDGSSRGTYGPLVQRALQAGCSLYTFGFGADHDAKLLAEIAELAQTPFTFVEDVEQIGAAFAGAVGGLTSVTVQRIAVTLSSSVPLKAVHTPFPIRQEGGQSVVQILDMLAGERRDVLVELSVPQEVEVLAQGGGDRLLMTASARYYDLGAGAVRQTLVAEMRLARSGEREGGEGEPEQEPDEEVAAQRDRVEVAQTLERAAACGDAGDFESAQRLLSGHEKRLDAFWAKKKAKGGGSSSSGGGGGEGGSGACRLSEAMKGELQEAQLRMRSHADWEDGGRAELRDARQMHHMQRTTNMNVSKKCGGGQQKMASKAMYANSVQKSWISKLG